MLTTIKRLLASLLSISLLAAMVPARAVAGPVDTAEAAQSAELALASEAPRSPEQARKLLADSLNRDEVRQQLVERGVSLEQAQARIASLSDDEARELARVIDQAPAGAGIIGAILFVFVLLLVTDILGLTKVFPFTRRVR